MLVKILSGISGSGKSTYARRHRGVIVSADDYFVRDGAYRFNPARLSSAHATCFARYLGALDDGHPLVIVDNTNTTAVEIAPYVLAAQAKGYDHEYCRNTTCVQLPDGDPIGPFASEREAIEDCQDEPEPDYCPLCGEDRDHPTQHGQHDCWRKG